MKKLFLSGAALMLAAASFAQNTATTTQTGTSQTATANQSGANLKATISQVGTVANNTNNDGYIKQSVAGHTATINQNNGSTYNRAAVTQVNTGSAASGSTATISQSNGAGGTSRRNADPNVSTAGAGNWAGVSQDGSGNAATITADGANTTVNFAETWQKGTDNTGTTTQSGATDNRGEIFQGDDTRGGTPSDPASTGTNVAVTGNTATIDQTNSATNDAAVRQFSNTNTATVTQTGVNSMSNTASVQQGDGTDLVGQSGNVAILNQLGNSSGNSGKIMQTSNSASATLRQEDYYGIPAKNNVAFINQVTGTGSQATIFQIGGSSNTATVGQWGNRNLAEVVQIAGGGPVNNSSATVNQGSAAVNGDGNKAFIYMNSNVYSGTATINQNQTVAGQSNFAQIDMSTTSLNIATVSQEGSYNEAGVYQTGVGSNTATVSQNGDYNVVGGPSSGNYNGKSASFAWAPHKAAGSALQQGTGNSLAVTQTAATGVGTVDVYNDTRTSQVGDMNTISVNQTLSAGATAANMSTISQNGMGNAAVVTQTSVVP